MIYPLLSIRCKIQDEDPSLTCGDKALGRRANDLTKIVGNFAIISSHYYVLI